eukprot:8926337-Pyramimonas_sp.AAC.2
MLIVALCLVSDCNLQHVQTKKWLHSHLHQSPLSGNQEVRAPFDPNVKRPRTPSENRVYLFTSKYNNLNTKANGIYNAAVCSPSYSFHFKYRGRYYTRTQWHEMAYGFALGPLVTNVLSAMASVKNWWENRILE